MVQEQGKFVLEEMVGWVDGFIVCPRGLQSAWAQLRAHPTFIDFEHKFRQNKLAPWYKSLCELNSHY